MSPHAYPLDEISHVAGHGTSRPQSGMGWKVEAAPTHDESRRKGALRLGRLYRIVLPPSADYS